MILVTGATGFIGSHFLKKNAGRLPLRCLTRRASLSKLPAGVEAVPGDLATGEGVAEAMKGVDSVLHLGALLRKKSPAEIRKVNVEGTRRLIEEALKQKIRRFVFVSTENALREDLSDAYASTKREAEAAVQAFPGALIFRPCFVYGPGDTHGLGRLVEMAAKSPIVPLFGGLHSRIQPIYVEDTVEYLARGLQGGQKGAYVLAGLETLSLNDFLQMACGFRGLKRTFVRVPRAVFKAAAIALAPFPSAGWGPNQLKNIYGSRTYSIGLTIRDFDFAPRRLEEGLRAWLSKKAA